MCLVTLSEGRWWEITFVQMGAECVCVPSVAFCRMPLVWRNHGSDVDLNVIALGILNKGRASVVWPYSQVHIAPTEG